MDQYLILFVTAAAACLVQAAFVKTAGHYVTQREWELIAWSSILSAALCSLLGWLALRFA